MSKNIPAPLNLEAGRSKEDDRILRYYIEAVKRRKGGNELRHLAYLGAIIRDAGVGDVLIALDEQGGPHHAVSCIGKITDVVQDSLRSLHIQDSQQELPKTINVQEELPALEKVAQDNHSFFPKSR